MTDPILWKAHRRNGAVEIIDEAEKQRQSRLQRPRYCGYERARIHECSVCQKRDAWRDSWSWYGSISDMDDEKPIFNFCSEECRKKGKADGLVPRNAAWIDDD